MNREGWRRGCQIGLQKVYSIIFISAIREQVTLPSFAHTVVSKSNEGSVIRFPAPARKAMQAGLMHDDLV